MLKPVRLLIFFTLGLCQIASAAPAVKIISLSGEVKVRRGVEETWHHANTGILLDDVDTILTGEASTVVLELPDGGSFRLGGFAILDIADLKKITEREMFLFLMAQKVHKIPLRPEKAKLRIGNVSVMHGESKAGAPPNQSAKDDSQDWIQETNGAKALYDQHYYPNAIVKLHKVLGKYLNREDCGEIHFYLGKAFEALDKTGQVVDAYQSALERLCENEASKQRAEETRRAIERLK
jgi:hypothetical protein